MTGKLVRNTSDPKWRAWWEAVEAAAANAPTLRFDEEDRVAVTTPGTSKKGSKTPRKAARHSARPSR